MNSRKHSFRLLGATIIAAAVLYAGWAVLRARRDLVTLNVRNMDVREAVKKIEWQTRETILVHKEVQGKVTLNVHRVPLEEVLRIIGDQTSSRWSALYPLYSTGKSLASFEKALRGEVDPATHGWTNLQERAFGPGGMGRGGMGGMFGPGGPAEAPQKESVSLTLQSKDLSFAVLAFNRLARTRVVPEDGATAQVSLSLNEVQIPKAVAQLAGKAGRKSTKLYTLRGQFGPGGPGGPGGSAFAGGPGGPQFAARNPNEPNGRGPGGPELTAEQREEMREQRETLETELKQSIPAAERQRLDEAQQQREQQFREMENLTPEQRRERFAQMGGAEMSRRNLDRIRNSTPEQRAQQRQQMTQMRQRMEQQRQQGGVPGQQPPPPPR